MKGKNGILDLQFDFSISAISWYQKNRKLLLIRISLLTILLITIAGIGTEKCKPLEELPMEILNQIMSIPLPLIVTEEDKSDLGTKSQMVSLLSSNLAANENNKQTWDV